MMVVDRVPSAGLSRPKDNFTSLLKASHGIGAVVMDMTLLMVASLISEDSGRGRAEWKAILHHPPSVIPNLHIQSKHQIAVCKWGNPSLDGTGLPRNETLHH